MYRAMHFSMYSIRMSPGPPTGGATGAFCPGPYYFGDPKGQHLVILLYIKKPTIIKD